MLSYAGLYKLCQPASLAVRKWRENEITKKRWRENEEMERKLDPVSSTVRYEMMKLCTGSV